MASYEIPLIIALEKKPHTITKDTVKPCIMHGVELVLSKDGSSKIPQTSLSNNTVKAQINQMAENT